MEYAPLKKCAEKFGCTDGVAHSREYIKFSVAGGRNQLDVTAVFSGVGKVNAAAAAAYLIAEGADYIFSAGLSGGLNHIARGEVMVSTQLTEHDFDLTPLGYKPGQKPQEKYIFESDDRLIALCRSVYPSVKTGAVVSGDRFVCGDGERKRIIDLFGAMSCDMESAAVASVCGHDDIPFAAIRKISDDAGENAGESYTQMNDLADTDLAEILLTVLEKMAEDDRFFE